MPTGPGPTLRARWLGKRLRELRERNSLTLKQAGEYLQRNLSMIARFESGEYPIRLCDLLSLLYLYNFAYELQPDDLLRLA